MIGFDVAAHLLGGFALKIPAKQNVAAQLVLGHRLCRAGVGAADKEHLAHFLLYRHGREQLLDDLVLIFRPAGLRIDVVL